MRLNKLEVRTSQGSLLTLPFDDISDGLYVQKIEGLDPVKATLVSSSFAQLDGAQYHTSRREPRNIKLSLGLEPNFLTDLVGDIRDRLYGFFMPKTEVRLQFYTYLERLNISGRIESFETALWSKDSVVNISIMCFDPDFYESTSVIFDGMTTSGLTETLLDYGGTVETGILFKLFPQRTFSAFTIYHTPPDGTLRVLEFASTLSPNDVLTISTSVGSKYVTRLRSGVETSMLYALSPQSNWIELLPGENDIRVYAEGLPIPFTIEYTPKYGGL